MWVCCYYALQWVNRSCTPVISRHGAVTPCHHPRRYTSCIQLASAATWQTVHWSSECCADLEQMRLNRADGLTNVRWFCFPLPAATVMASNWLSSSWESWPHWPSLRVNWPHTSTLTTTSSVMEDLSLSSCIFLLFYITSHVQSIY